MIIEHKDLEDLINIQKQCVSIDGDIDEYMRGLLNGLICANAAVDKASANYMNSDGSFQESFGEEQYVVKRLDDDTFDVVKFTDSKYPDDSYRVTYDKAGYHIYCSCPGFRHTPGDSHKHVRIVRKFLDDGEPVMAYYTLDDMGNPSSHIQTQKDVDMSNFEAEVTRDIENELSKSI